MSFFRRLLFLTVLPAFVSGMVHAGDCDPGFPEHNPDSIYLVHGNGTVTDTRTRLMWKLCAEGQSWNGNACAGDPSTHTWEEALMLAEGHTFAGRSDWRLPNRNELQSLVETCRTNPATNTTIFPMASSGWHFWSSTPFADNSNNAWIVYFSLGHTSNNNRSSASSVLLVRDGQ